MAMMDTQIDDSIRVEAGPLPAARGLRLNYETVIYALLIALALALRIAELDTVPLTLSETHDALAAWRAITPNAPGEPLIASSPILHLLMAMGFATLGANEFAARILTVLAGAAIVVLPLAFRPWLGPVRTLLFSAVLACSPTLLLASREANGAIIGLFLTLLLLWALYRLYRTRRPGYGVAVVVLGTVAIFLTESGGAFTVAMPLIAAWIASWWNRRAERRYAFEAETDEQEAAPSIAALIPWPIALPAAALLVLALATGFMLYSTGLTGIGSVIAGFFSGFAAQAVPQAPPLYPWLVSIFYETFAWGLAAASIVMLVRLYRFGFLERMFAIWLGLGLFVSVIWPGGRAEHAIWFAVPLAGLIAPLLEALVTPDELINSVHWPVPYWARWVLGLVVLLLLMALAAAFQGIARALLNAPNGEIAAVNVSIPTLVLFVVTLMFIVVSYFMAGSLWDHRTALRGLGLGIALFGLLTALGSGWTVAVPRADSAAQFWRLQVVHPDQFLLRATLLEVARRQARGFTTMPMAVLAAQDGPAAWAVRDFVNARFITAVDDAFGAEVVLVGNGTFPGNWGAPYVGQDFTQVHTWSPATLYPIDLPAYWSLGEVRTPVIGLTNNELWLRQDVYDGVDPAASPRG